jgi:hypothetical protein
LKKNLLPKEEELIVLLMIKMDGGG